MGKDERITVDNHRTLEVYADQTITTGGNYTHEVSGKTEWQSGELFKQVCKQFDAVGYEEVRLASDGKRRQYTLQRCIKGILRNTTITRQSEKTSDLRGDA